MNEYINQPEVELATGERETPKMKLTHLQRVQLNSAYDTLSRLISLGIDTENDKLVQACENVQNIIDEI